MRFAVGGDQPAVAAVAGLAGHQPLAGGRQGGIGRPGIRARATWGGAGPGARVYRRSDTRTARSGRLICTDVPGGSPAATVLGWSILTI